MMTHMPPFPFFLSFLSIISPPTNMAATHTQHNTGETLATSVSSSLSSISSLTPGGRRCGPPSPAPPLSLPPSPTLAFFRAQLIPAHRRNHARHRH